jgi:AraC-like DNA-binding protein
MKPEQSIEREISDRFRTSAPTRVSSLAHAPAIAFSRIKCEQPGHGRSKTPRPEDAYAIHIMLAPTSQMGLRVNGRQIAIPALPRGGVILEHLEAEPVADYQSAFDFLRLYIARSTLDALSEGSSDRPFEGLRRPEYGAGDPMLLSLALSTAELLRRGLPEDQLLLDQMALAFHAHLVQAYAGASRDPRLSTHGGLAPWQEKRAKAYLEANLGQAISLAEVAAVCGLSASHFARAFRAATGRPPHQWLLQRRIDAAKRALKASDQPLAQIAELCGFSDPSHFSRAFGKATGETPAAWRRSQGRSRALVGLSLDSETTIQKRNLTAPSNPSAS